MGSPGVGCSLLLIFHVGFLCPWAGLLEDPASGHCGRRKAIQNCAIQRLTWGGGGVA